MLTNIKIKLNQIKINLQPYMLKFAGLVCVLIFPLLFLNTFEIKLISSKPAAVVFLLMDLSLIFIFVLWKDINVSLLVLFVVWMGFASMHEGTTAIKAFGGSTPRYWLICISVFLTGYLMRGDKRKKWISAMLASFVIPANICFVLVFIRALGNLFDTSKLTDLTYGEFRNGRLHGLNNANTLGAVAALSLVAFVWMAFEAFKKKKISIVLPAFFGLFDLLIIGLSRSRGAIFAGSCGIGIVIFCYAYGKIKDANGTNNTLKHNISPTNKKSFKKVTGAIGVSLLVAIVCVFAIILLKKPFDACIRIIAKQKMSDSEYERIANTLVPYGMDYAIDTLTDRTLIWPATIRMFAENHLRWVFGYTAADSVGVRINYIYPGRPELWAVYAHNGLLQYLITYGIPGILLIAAIAIVWTISGLKLFFSEKPSPIVAFGFIPLVLGIVEVHPFPFWALTFPTLLFFFAAGICGSFREKKKMEKRAVLPIAINILSILLIFCCFIIGASKVAQTHRKTVPQGIIKTSDEAKNQYDAAVPVNLRSASGWITELEKQGHKTNEVIMNEAEIAAFNHKNRKLLHVYDQDIDIRDIGAIFNGEVLKKAIEETCGASGDENKSLNLDAIGRTVDTVFAVSKNETSVYTLPIDSNKGDSISALHKNEPVIVLHCTADEKWSYCFAYGFGGWVRTDELLNVPNKDEWLKYFERNEMLPFTEENVICAAFEMLGRRYGTGMSENDVETTFPLIDCSGFVHDIYARFGFELPRTSKAQADVSGVQTMSFFPFDFVQKNCFEKLHAGALLYFNGHIMIYLGTVDGVPYCISSVDEVMTFDSVANLRVKIGEVSVTNMDYTLRSNRKTWLDSVEKVISFK